MNKSSSLLTAYRVLAYVTGVGLILLTLACIGDYVLNIKGASSMVFLVGAIHGWAYMIYVVLSFSIGNKLRWPLGKMVLVILAGTIPTCSFIAERKVMKRIAEQQAELAAKQQLVNA